MKFKKEIGFLVLISTLLILCLSCRSGKEKAKSSLSSNFNSTVEYELGTISFDRNGQFIGSRTVVLVKGDFQTLVDSLSSDRSKLAEAYKDTTVDWATNLILYSYTLEDAAWLRLNITKETWRKTYRQMDQIRMETILFSK